MGDSKISKNNLARIRDNQRRSRARRKEYLHELEQKYRSCQQLGIEASAEVQAAARKVLDENRKLRLLLRERGVSEPEVNAYLNASSDESQSLNASTSLNNLISRRVHYTEDSSSTTQDWIPRDSPRTIGSAVHQTRYHTPSLQHDNTRSGSPHSNDSPISVSDAHSTYSHFSTQPTEDYTSEPANFPRLSYQYDLGSTCHWPLPINSYTPPQSQLGYASSLSRVPPPNLISGPHSEVGVNLETTLACTQPGLTSNPHTFDLVNRYDNPHYGP